MDSSDFPISRSPRKELQGPRPPALKIRKDSHKIKKPPVAPKPSHQPRPPVIIYTLSPKVIHTNPNDFMNLVQRLTATSTSSNPFNDHDCGAISPAARYATIEKAKSPKDQQKQQLGGDVGFVEGIMEIDQVMERTNLGPGILSPGPASLPPIPPNFFSPASADPNSGSFFHDLSPVLHGNRNFIDGGFLPSPSTFFSPSTPSVDLFNNFNTYNSLFDF
ncbi:nuclear speckle RNA-binding protein B-like [Populus alba x Populus x berolinensis]|uniref:Nuclear speckle RNA-binding protein B-like n=1 Tax=Populus alba x Populus x berolinensis TaxID=444605 RepID=A0AAD6QWL6_9ROSI|nr:nuclear speckle RNA-binding protein B-like [Populus alba x Populus x berolinensis]